MISVKPVSPDKSFDPGAVGQGPPVDVEGSQDENAGVAGDEDMSDMVLTGADSAQEADARRTRIAERLGTEAEWEDVVDPPVIEDVEGHIRLPRGERIRPVTKPGAFTNRER